MASHVAPVPSVDSRVRESLTRHPRFWSRVDFSAGLEGCWPFDGYTNRDGYPQVGYPIPAPYHRNAHRVAWELVHGPAPIGMVICHACDNRACVNPAHLWLGTRAENNADRDRKERMMRGERHVWAKLNEDAVREIRRRRAAGEPVADVARRFGVSYGAVKDVTARRRWAHVR